jgi:hypothetical protein
MKRIFLIAVCLLAAMPALGAGMFGGPREPGKTPTRFVRFDGFDMGVWTTRDVFVGPAGLWGKMASVTVVLNRMRFGISYADIFSAPDWWGGAMTLPLRVGYTLYSVPKKTCLFWSNAADVYLEASGSLLTSPGLRVALCLDDEYYGLGTRLEFGWASIHASGNWSPGPHQDNAHISFIYAGFQLRFVTFGIGF